MVRKVLVDGVSFAKNCWRITGGDEKWGKSAGWGGGRRIGTIIREMDEIEGNEEIGR